MSKRSTSTQAEIEFSDFVHATRPEGAGSPNQGLTPEEQPVEVRDAIEDGLRQLRAGQFADEGVIKAILRRAGM